MYKIITQLAFNNAFLRLSRTLLVIIMIAVSMSMMLSIEGLYDGMSYNLINKTKRSDSGDVALYQKNYRLTKSLKETIKDSDKIIADIKKIEGVKAVVSRIEAEGLAATARKSRFAKIVGIDLDEEESFGKFSDFLKEGELEFKKRGAIVGIELAKKLKLKIGSKLIFSTQDSSGEINSIALRVKAIVQTSNISLDSTAIFIQREKLRKFLALKKSEVTQIAIMGEGVEKRLKDKYPSLDVKTFLELYPMMKQTEDMMNIFNSITFFIVMLVVFIGIMGVMYVSILDRIREFGILKSIGYAYKYIRLQIILEALFMSLTGYLFGAILGYIALYYLHSVGVDLSAYADGLESFGYPRVMHAQIKVIYFITTFFAIVLASLLSVLLPLRKIKNMNTIEVTKANT